MIRQLLCAMVTLVLTIPAIARDDKVSIRGMPASVSPADEESKKSGVLGSILIEGRKDKDTEFEKAIVKVTKGTKIYRQVGKELKEASFSDLRPGVKMEIHFQGPVAESFPVQATAGKIVIVGGR